ncbi:zinc finger protein 572-like isoform X1 [Hyperolius riggenbachi]|uniref:zinc finger protein 572-like isoform X1 n=2 Tax=Hyperolius riggenbachi TaxID=752182 RepID=UPI0035A2BEC5
MLNCLESKMNEEKHTVMDEILRLSLQIMCLLTGEDYKVVKKCGEPVKGSAKSSMMEDNSTSMEISDLKLENRFMLEKLLELAYKISDELDEFSEKSGFLEESCEGSTQPKDISEHLTNLFNLVKKMTKDKNQMIGNIVTHTLELIYLLIGEDYIIVKKCSKTTVCNSFTLEEDASPVVREPTKVNKILEFNNKIIKLLTEKITLKTEDAEVYSTMREYLKGYREFFKDVTMDHEQNQSIGRSAVHSSMNESSSSKTSMDSVKHEGVTEQSDVNLLLQSKTSKRKSKPTRIVFGEFPARKKKNRTDTTVLSLKKKDPAKDPALARDSRQITKHLPKDDLDVAAEDCTFGKPDKDLNGILDNVGIIQTIVKDDHKPPSSEDCQSELPLHSLSEKLYECTVCGKNFTKKSHLQSHRRVHSGIRPFACLDCGKRFTSNSTLVDHQRIHTGEKPFVCSECGRCFTKNSNLIDHQRTHTGEKPFACTACGKCFARSSNLVEHQKTHTGEKSFVCSECGKGFSRSSTLAEHQKTHTRGETYICSECGQCFTKNSSLVRHQSIHTGQKPYICTVCGKGFSSSSNLVRHHITHTGEKPFTCPLCGRTFNQNSNLISHQKTHKVKTVEVK